MNASHAQQRKPAEPPVRGGSSFSPVFRRVSRCVRGSGLGWRVYPPQPLETNVAAFVAMCEKVR